MCIIVPLSPSGRYSCVYAEFVFHRKFGYYLIQIYVPSVLVVLLSWVSFWLDASSVPARVSLGLLTILTMTSQMSGASASLPKVYMDHSLSNYWPFARRIYRSSVDSPHKRVYIAVQLPFNRDEMSMLETTLRKYSRQAHVTIWMHLIKWKVINFTSGWSMYDMLWGWSM